MAAVLPALLPSPPRSQMRPLLPTPCLIILPADFSRPSLRPGRADAVDRWDASRKEPSAVPVPLPSSGSPDRAAAGGRNHATKKPSSPVSVSSSSTGSTGRPGRADAVDRWDTNKKLSTTPAPSSSGGSSSSQNGSPGRASACDRWDSNKTKSPGGASATSSKRERCGGKASGRASSAERWDIHKKPRPLQPDERERDLAIDNDDDTQTNTDHATEASEVAVEVVVKPAAVFSGASFFSSPEPSTLPMPCFLRAG